MHFGLTDRYFVAFDGKQFHIIISGIQITDIDHAVLIQILVVSHAVQTHIKALPGHRRTLIIHDLDTQILFNGSRYQGQAVAVVFCCLQDRIYFLIKKCIVF